jgi:hypothetical protein
MPFCSVSPKNKRGRVGITASRYPIKPKYASEAANMKAKVLELIN